MSRSCNSHLLACRSLSTIVHRAAATPYVGGHMKTSTTHARAAPRRYQQQCHLICMQVHTRLHRATHMNVGPWGHSMHMFLPLLRDGAAAKLSICAAAAEPCPRWMAPSNPPCLADTGPCPSGPNKPHAPLTPVSHAATQPGCTSGAFSS
jgi:hypothetical protein